MDGTECVMDLDMLNLVKFDYVDKVLGSSQFFLQPQQLKKYACSKSGQK